MRLAAVITAALLLASCASTGPVVDRPVLDLFVDNQITSRVTVYVTKDGVIVRRIGDCPPVSSCLLGIPASVVAGIDVAGVLEVGWRFGAMRNAPGTWVISTVQTTYWEGMSAELTLGRLTTWLYPTGDREA